MPESFRSSCSTFTTDYLNFNRYMGHTSSSAAVSLQMHPGINSYYGKNLKL